MPEIAVFATDLHGEIQDYERVLDVASGKNVKAVIIGGDIAPFLSATGDVAVNQRDFMEFYLIPRLHDFRKKTKKDVFIMMGNDDLRINSEILEKGEKQGAFSLINQQVCRIGRKHIAGYSYINEAPFPLKDWEKDEKKIKKDLDRLAKLSNPRKTIYSMHAPPLGTNLDVIFNGEHVGSSAIRKFILEKQPYLTLHGHIHESFRMTGQWKDMLGDTVSVNPGTQSMLVFDINDLKTMQVLRV
jgi:Icc-related predicted phosphoesterase